MTGGARALLVALIALVLLSPVAALPPAAADAHLGEGILRFEVAAVEPAVLTPDGTVSVRATLHNDSATAASDLLVRLMGYSVRLPSREAVRAWASEEYGVRAGDRPLAELAVPLVPAGASVPVQLDAPASALRLPAAAGAWGPRGLTLEVLDDDYDQLAVARAFTVWDPRPERDRPVALTVLAPFTGGLPDVDTGLVPADRMAELTAEGGRLARVLEAASAEHVAWVVDPAVLLAAREPAADWLDALARAARDRDVLTLPRSDPDLVAIADAGAADLYRLAARMGRRAAADVLPTPATADVAWPASGAADEAGLALAADSGAGMVVLSGGAHPAAEPVEGTASGHGTVRVGTDRLEALLVDTGLSATLTSATQDGVQALATSRLLAETAVVAQEDGNPTHLLLALPRSWDPDTSDTSAALAALEAAPWLQVAPLGDLLDRPGPDVGSARSRLPAPEGVAELPADGLRDLARWLLQTRQLASALTSPDGVLDPLETSAVAATALAWRDDLDAWRGAVAQVGAAAAGVASAVHVIEGSAVTVVSSQVDLPVTVANDLEQEVEVVVSVQPRTSRLVAESDARVRIPAQSTERVAVPVRAVANGNTDVVVTVRAPDGVQLGQPVTVPVRVRADWETRGILVAGGVLVVVLVVGLTRTILRGRRRGEPAGERRR